MSTPTVQSEPAPAPGQAPADNGAPGRMADQRRAFSPPELAFLIGLPLAWAVLLLFHPGGEGTELTYQEVQDKVTAWLVVHIGMMLFIPLMAAVFYLLLRGVEGTAARISRIALVPFVVFYSAWEALQGIAAPAHPSPSRSCWGLRAS